MASTVLYPPIVDSAMPAFYGDDCRIYYNLSKFNISSDFKTVHVAITKQRNGAKAVDSSKAKHRAGIIIDKPVSIDTSGNYYVEISKSDIIGNSWSIGDLYKVQVRLANATYGSSSIGESAWLVQNASSFSEWSTVCVIKPIGASTLTWVSFGNNKIKSSEIIGQYSNADTSEKLYQYKIKLFSNSGTLLTDSGWQYTNQYQNSNEIKYNLEYELISGNVYKIAFEYYTINNYNQTIEYSNLAYTAASSDATGIEVVTLETDYDVEIDGTITDTGLYKVSSVYDEEEEGRIAIMFNGTDSDTSAFSGNYYLCRSDMYSNYTVWKDIKKVYFPVGAYVDHKVVYDYSIESGVFYQYAIQSLTPNGERGPLVKMQVTHKKAGESPEFPKSYRDTHYAYLVGKDEQQLKIKYDENISSFKINVAEGTQTPIGSQFPLSRRGGATYYKSFSITGLISFNMDENYIFASKDKIYGVSDITIFEDIEKQNGIYNYNYERKFRDSVMKFLYDGKPKLFKSATEGNILVKLSDISFTPNQQLSNLTYNFSATVTEMGEATIENLRKYNIIVNGMGNNVNVKGSTSTIHTETYPSTHKAYN